MPLLRKLKSLLAGGDEEDERDVTVTVEHDPESEAAVKGTGGTGATTASIEDDVPGEGAASADEPVADEAPAAVRDAEPIEEAEPEDAGDESAADEPAAAEAEEGTATGAEDAAEDGESVEAINGVGPTYADRLAAAGIETVADLAAADVGEVSDAAEAPEGRVSDWIEQAQDR